MAHLALQQKTNLSSFRRIAIGTWQNAYDPSVYGSLTVRVDKTLDYLEKFRKATGRRLTISHMMAKLASHVMREVPDANAIMRFNRIYLRRDVGVFFQVAMEDEKTGELDLSGTVIYDADKKSLVDIVDEFEAKVKKVRDHKDESLEHTRSTFKMIPFLLLNWVLKIISFFSYTLNLDLRWAKIPADPFGSVMVTNVGSLGLDVAYPPLVPYSRVPLLIATSAVKEAPVVENGKVVVGNVMHVCATFDHRILDGAHAAPMSAIIRSWLEDPQAHFGPIPE